MSTSKTVNGILRKGSLREEDERSGGGGGMPTPQGASRAVDGGSSTRKSSRRTGESRNVDTKIILIFFQLSAKYIFSTKPLDHLPLHDLLNKLKIRGE